MSKRPGHALCLSCIGLNVSDLRESVRFYQKALGFMPYGEIMGSDPAREQLLGGECTSLRMRLGNQYIELTQFAQPGASYPSASTAADLWFQHFAIVTRDMNAAYEQVRQQGAIPITQGGPQQLPASSGGVTAYKFRDPDGHPLELLAFPGDISAAGTLNCGIDHTAISVADVNQSMAFYCDWLGFSQASRQLNHGQKQERLDALTDVAVEVVALNPRSVQRPHVELLAYQRPRGRALAGRHANDIAATRMHVQVDKLSALIEKPLPEAALVSRNDCAALVADPDGHLLWLEESA